MNSTVSRESRRIVEDAGGVFVRHARHGAFYRLGNGQMVLVAGSAGDQRSLANLRADLKRALRKVPA